MFGYVTEIAGKYAPPAALSFCLSIMIYSVPKQLSVTWPILGNFVMDNALKAIMIAIVWFLVFSGLAIWKHLHPTYRDEVYADVKTLREHLTIMHSDFYSNEEEWSKVVETLRPFQVKIPSKKGLEAFYNVLDIAKECWGFHMTQKFQDATEKEKSKYFTNEENFHHKIKHLLKETEWVLSK